VEPGPIVIVVDELLQRGAQFIDVLVLVGIDFLSFEGIDKALAEGVVVGVGAVL
jgi:hypothetical protein